MSLLGPEGKRQKVERVCQEIGNPGQHCTFVAGTLKSEGDGK